MWWHNTLNTGNNGSRKATYRDDSPTVDHGPLLADSQTAQHGERHSHRLAGQRLDAHQPRNLNTAVVYKHIFMDSHSVADPGSLSRIRVLSIPDPDIRIFQCGSRIHIKKFKNFNPKKSFLSSPKYDPVVHPGSGSWFFTHPVSRIQWSKRHRIRIRNTRFSLDKRTLLAATVQHYFNLKLKVPKCEIFDRSDFHDFYSIKPFWVGDFGAKI